jgi:hypothetical protein
MDSAQTAAVTTILARHQNAVDSRWRAMNPAVRANLDATIHDVMRVREPEQKGKSRDIAPVLYRRLLP